MSNETTWTSGLQKDETIETLARRASAAESRVVDLERALERAKRTIGELMDPPVHVADPDPIVPKPGWQPIETAPIGKHVLVIDKDIDEIAVAFMNSCETRLSKPTHWMPLPEPPGGD